MKTRYKHIKPFITQDGSTIRELMHPASHGNKNQSFAEAIININAETLLHRHRLSEELYYINQGEGLMTLGKQSFVVKPGDTIYIKPGTAHKIRNTGQHALKIFCCCAPAYSHEDTTLLPDNKA